MIAGERLLQGKAGIIRPVPLQVYDPETFGIVAETLGQLAEIKRSKVNYHPLPALLVRATGGIVLGHLVDPRDAVYSHDTRSIRTKSWSGPEAGSIAFGTTLRSHDPLLGHASVMEDWDGKPVLLLETLGPGGRELPPYDRVSIEVEAPDALMVYPYSAVTSPNIDGFNAYGFLQDPAAIRTSPHAQ